MNYGIATLCAFCIVLSFSRSDAAEIAVDQGQTFQTIEGFGAFDNVTARKVKEGPFYIDEPMDSVYNLLAYDLGLTIIRQEIPSTFQTSAGGPFDFDARDGMSMSTRQRILHMRELKKRGIEKFIATVWSPPAYMKTNNSTTMGGSLKTDMYDDFVDYCIHYVKHLYDSTGIDLYALSLQNELAFSQPFASCTYTYDQYKNLLKVAGPRFSSQAPNTMLFGPECMGTYSRGDGVYNYVSPIKNDPAASAALDVVAVHSYKDGVAPDYGSADGWSDIFNLADSFDKPVWMTETSGYESTFSGALSLAKSIYLALKFGRISAWVWWSTQDADGSPNSLINEDHQPQTQYYAHKHYARFIRPGAKMIRCNSSDNEVLATAFKHDVNDCITLVIINNSSSAKSVALSGSNLPSVFKKFVSNQFDRCAYKGETDESSITLSPNSILTLVNGRYRDNPGAVKTARPNQKPLHIVHEPDCRSRIFSVNGKQIANERIPVRLLSKGIYITGDKANGARKTYITDF